MCIPSCSDPRPIPSDVKSPEKVSRGWRILISVAARSILLAHQTVTARVAIMLFVTSRRAHRLKDVSGLSERAAARMALLCFIGGWLLNPYSYKVHADDTVHGYTCSPAIFSGAVMRRYGMTRPSGKAGQELAAHGDFQTEPSSGGQQKLGGLHQGNSPTPTIDHLQRKTTIDQSQQLSCDHFVILVQRSQKIGKKFQHLVFLRDDALVERVHRIWELRRDAKKGASYDARRVHGTLDLPQSREDIARGLGSIYVLPKLAFLIIEIRHHQIIFAIEVAVKRSFGDVRFGHDLFGSCGANALSVEKMACRFEDAGTRVFLLSGYHVPIMASDRQVCPPTILPEKLPFFQAPNCLTETDRYVYNAKRQTGLSRTHQKGAKV